MKTTSKHKGRHPERSSLSGKSLCIKVIGKKDLKRFKELAGKFHYMGEGHAGGDVATEQDGRCEIQVTCHRRYDALAYGPAVVRSLRPANLPSPPLLVRGGAMKKGASGFSGCSSVDEREVGGQ
jgi:hypothetical protein